MELNASSEKLRCSCEGLICCLQL